MTRRSISRRARDQARVNPETQIENWVDDAIRRGDLVMQMINGEPAYQLTDAGLERLARLRKQST